MKERMTIDSLQMSTPVASPASVKVKKFVVDDNEEDRLVTSPTKHSVGDTPTKKWIRKEKIGQGAQGAVYRCEEAATGKEVAAKVILTHELSPSEVEAIRREVKIIKRLQHPNLVQYYKATGNKKHTMNIYMEYVSGGSLSGKLRREGALPLPTIKKYTRQLLKALQYLHQNRIAHRDIKCANIFLTSDEKLIKLGDFGAFKEMGSVSLVGGIKGTPHWMAPEVIREQQTSSDGWFKADIWSLGCTVLEMLTGHAPWQQYSNPLTAMYQIVCSNATPTIPDSAPEDTTTFLKWCLQRNPDDRPSTDQLLDHEFAKKKTTNRKASIKRKSVTIESENQAEKPFLLLSPIGKETQPQRSAGCETDDEEHEDTIELSHDLSASSIADEKATATKGCEAKHPLPMHAPRRPSLIPRLRLLEPRSPTAPTNQEHDHERPAPSALPRGGSTSVLTQLPRLERRTSSCSTSHSPLERRTSNSTVVLSPRLERRTSNSHSPYPTGIPTIRLRRISTAPTPSTRVDDELDVTAPYAKFKLPPLSARTIGTKSFGFPDSTDTQAGR